MHKRWELRLLLRDGLSFDMYKDSKIPMSEDRVITVV